MTEKNHGVQIHCNIIDGNVMVTFGQPISWLRLSPDEAAALAETIKKMVDVIHSEASSTKQ